MPKVQTARGGKAPYEFTGAAEELFGEDLPEFTNIKVVGEVEDSGKNYIVSGRITCTKTFTCDRCLTQAKAAQVHKFAEDFPKHAVTDDFIDVTELLRDVLLAAQPIKNLCKPDCKGLCHECGANLNDGECTCDKFIINPKFADLENFKLEEV